MLKFITCTLLFWAVVPFVVPLLICLYIYRAFVVLLQKLVHSDWIGIVNPRDMVVWEDMKKPRLQCAWYSIVLLEGEEKFDLAEFQGNFMDRVISYRNPQGECSYAKFEHYFENWLGFPFWRKERNFSIKQHIRLLAPDSVKSGKVMTEEQLHKLSGDLMTRPFEAKTSPWEILIVPNYQPKKCEDFERTGEKTRFAAIFRFHHSLLDGYSSHKMFVERISGETVTKLAPSAPSRAKKRGIFGRLERFMEILLNLGMYHARFFILDRDFNIWHGKGNKKLTRTNHTAKSDGVPFSVVRNVSKKLGVAPTATIFSCLAGGIRRYFEMKQEEIPEKMTAFFPWPVDNHPMDGLVNHWSFVDMLLLLGEKDRVRRIKETNVHFQALKNSPLPEIMWDFSPLFSAVPTPFFDFWGWNRKSTLAITNFPGSTTSLTYFGKWKLVGSTGFLPSLRGNSAAQICTSTTCGNIYVTITADRGILSEEGTKVLARCIEQEFKNLDDLC